MVLRRLLGEIMTDMGFITNSQLEKTLNRQKEIFEERTLQKESKETFPIPQVRIAHAHEKTPLLGIILNYMGFATIEEIVVITDNGCEFLSDRQTEIFLVKP